MSEKYLSELLHFDGESFIKFNIVEVNLDKGQVTVAITNQGKISVNTFDLLGPKNDLFFEYGVMLDEIYIEDFTQIKGEN